jgi:6-pyruvoyltetrahydropterin/6-carboxytetrahydropterin synthase
MIADSLGTTSRIVNSPGILQPIAVRRHPVNCKSLALLGMIIQGMEVRGADVSSALKRYNKTHPRNREFMYEVTVEDTFAAGHYLRNYKGKCENPHGHNYKIRVTLAGAELDKAGLLLDFKDLKEVMKHAVDRLDHQMINDIEPFTTLNPSAENLAKYFYDETNTRLRGVTNGRVRVKHVTVFETDVTTARYSE